MKEIKSINEIKKCSQVKIIGNEASAICDVDGIYKIKNIITNEHKTEVEVLPIVVKDPYFKRKDIKFIIGQVPGEENFFFSEKFFRGFGCLDSDISVFEVM